MQPVVIDKDGCPIDSEGRSLRPEDALARFDAEIAELEAKKADAVAQWKALHPDKEDKSKKGE